MAEPSWPDLLAALLRREELASGATAWAMGEIMSGAATPAQIAAFVTALRAKGETAVEVTGLVEAMLAHATRVTLPAGVQAAAVDIVGTGGDRAHTVNISTMAAVVIAAAGVPVVKHGNRAATSSCGAADLLEKFGIPLDLGPEQVARCVVEAGIGFCFAPRFHPGMRHAAVPRRELGVPTVFNILGPLSNPAQPAASAIGCADVRLAPVMAQVFAGRGQTALVMRGEDGLDELTTGAATRVWVAAGGTVREVVVDAADLGLPRSAPGALRGGDPAANAEVAQRVFAGEPGPVRDAVLVNAAAGLAVQEEVVRGGAAGAGSHAGGAGGAGSHAGAFGGDLSKALRVGLERAAAAVDSGAAAATLERWRAIATLSV